LVCNEVIQKVSFRTFDNLKIFSFELKLFSTEQNNTVMFDGNVASADCQNY